MAWTLPTLARVKAQPASKGARGALARKDVGKLQQAARAAKDGGRAPRQKPRAEGEAALEGAAGESLERHGPTSLS